MKSSSNPRPTPLFLHHPVVDQMHPYALKRIISKHDGSINRLAFSQDGPLFASGADDGLIVVFEGSGSGQEIH